MRLQWIVLLLIAPLVVTAVSLSREQQIAGELTKTLRVGKPVQLQSKEHPFFGIHTIAERAKPIGGIILLHGGGAHPNWSDIVRPLRTQLPKKGWETLSIQMPLGRYGGNRRDQERLIPESLPRIAAAVKFLLQRRIERIVIIGHSLGAHMGLYYLASGATPKAISGLVAIGLSIPQENADATLKTMRKIKVPMLDLYGSQDLPPVQQTASLRATAAKMGGYPYQQVAISGANHHFTGLTDSLLSRITAWTKKIARQPAAP